MQIGIIGITQNTHSTMHYELREQKINYGIIINIKNLKKIK